MNVVLIVQARMGSSRLPGKVLLPALGKPMLAHQLERLRLVKSANDIVVATSTLPADDAIEFACSQYGINCFRGDENDVLSRFVGAAIQYNADVVVRLTADCPLIDPEIINQVIENYLENPGDNTYVSNTLTRTFPRGMDTEVFSSHLLFATDKLATSKFDREHVTQFMIRNDGGTITQRNIECWKNLSAYRYTLDHPKDYAQISNLLTNNVSDFKLANLMRRAELLGLNWHDNDEMSTNTGITSNTNTNANTNTNTNTNSKSIVKLYKRFGLGAAQLGMYYGRFNRDGVPSQKTTCNIIDRAAELGLSCIDTASLYGESEKILGNCASSLFPFTIITKTPRFSDDVITHRNALELRSAFEISLKQMQQRSVDGLLIHHAPNLLAEGGDLLYSEMLKLKKAGLVKRIGVSAYTGDIVEEIHKKFPLDLVQLPINMLDRRMINNGQLKRIAKLGIKVHARSAFLQGLLLTDPETLSTHFDSAKEILKLFHKTCHTNGIQPAHAALHYLLNIPEIEKIIIGVESLAQLNNIFDNFPMKINMDFEPFKIEKIEILNPVLWTN